MRDIAEPFRGTSPGGAPRPNNYETPYFWSVYILAAYESRYNFDTDSNGTGAILGATDAEQYQLSVVYVEPIRDVASYYGVLTEAEARARTTIHEVAHQFNLVEAGPDEEDPSHRNDGLNIMNSSTRTVPENLFYFHEIEIVSLRNRILSP